MNDQSPTRFDTAAIANIHKWLMDVRHDNDDGGAAFMRSLVTQLKSVGFPLWRVSYALITMHPEVLWRTVQWQEGTEVVVRDQTHARLDDDFYKKSPVAAARKKHMAIRVPLSKGSLPYPICEDLREQGGTDYYIQPLSFTNGQVAHISFATTAEQGFSEEAIVAFDAIRPFLQRRLELESSYYATRALLNVYLGRNAARRVSEGAFQRGKGELIDAAIWFSDMRDFTALSDRTPPAAVIETLDAYFDAVASAVAAHGGEVLKFIGDAVLAIFPVGEDPQAACRSALNAADEAFAALDILNKTRTKLQEPTIRIGVALHRGHVMYGNIGARDRLDFTVISSAVNEASRLESLCKSIGTNLALSEAFTKTANVDDLIDLGAHDLKGVKASLRVFTPRKHHTPQTPPTTTT